MYDLIGDIHGHADALERLLKQLGYARQKGVYGHPDRRAIFLGDFIDRGPKIRETLEIVRPMVESGTALSVMGNHELNALAFNTTEPKLGGQAAVARGRATGGAPTISPRRPMTR
jgi:hypothetical protein